MIAILWCHTAELLGCQLQAVELFHSDELSMAWVSFHSSIERIKKMFQGFINVPYRADSHPLVPQLIIEGGYLGCKIGVTMGYFGLPMN